MRKVEIYISELAHFVMLKSTDQSVTGVMVSDSFYRRYAEVMDEYDLLQLDLRKSYIIQEGEK